MAPPLDQAAGPAPRLVLLGRRDDMADLYRAADLVVQTSSWEGQPVAIQEALAAGAAVVATDVGGTREVAGGAACLTGLDPRDLAAAIGRLLDNPAQASDLRRRAQLRAAQLPTQAEALAQAVRAYARQRD
jgi:glycosyltransferase involved in cell wall biosynthesis